MFNYDEAFDRNIGWLTRDEQQKIRNSTVALAGLGGAGGFQAQALARLGVGRFKIADPDTFELTNRNRQIGATEETLGKQKVAVIRDMILAINPDASIAVYDEGIHTQNIDEFLEGADFVIDGIDFFALTTKFLLFDKCRELRKVVLTSCPLGFGASLITFSPDGMSFPDFFDLKPDLSDEQKTFYLAFGLSPTPLCLSYMNEKASQIGEGRAASVCPGLMLVGAVTATEAVKHLTGKGRIHYAPHVYQTDLFTQKTVKKFYPLGMRSPWMRLKKWFVIKFILPAKKRVASSPAAGKQPDMLTAGKALLLAAANYAG